MKHELNGFSGAKLKFVSVDSVTRIRKSAASINEGGRLRKQAYKQSEYSKCALKIYTPQILSEGYADGVYYFDMQFVAGVDGHRYLEKCSPDGLRHFLAKLTDHIIATRTLPPLVESNYDSWFEAAINKLLDIHEKTRSMDNALLGQLMAGLGRLRKLAVMDAGFCHGDLTLENIMVDGSDDLWLVDFLDSPFEHPWQDYVKLFQDICGGWFEIKGRRIGPAYQSYLYDGLFEVVKSIYPAYFDVHNVLMAVNFSRILPYVKNNEEKEFVLNRVKHYALLIS